jgi:ligand-binding SRPBCC domain-containing protein
MPTIRDQFRIEAPIAAIAAFHHDTTVLKKLTPPPVIVQIHRVEPLAENSISVFTLWFGPLPLRWQAVHSGVHPNSGFVDTQSRGPMAAWRHHHSWSTLPGGMAEMREEIEFEHKAGLPGLLTRILFAPPMLRLMLAYRRAVIRRACQR